MTRHNVVFVAIFVAMASLSAGCGVISIEPITESTPTVAGTPSTSGHATFTPYPTYAQPTATLPPTTTPTLDPSVTVTVPPPMIHSAEESKTQIETEKTASFLFDELIHDYREPQPGEPLSLKPYVLGNKAVIWDNWWCAVGENRLTNSLTRVTFTYEMDSAAVDPALAHRYQRKMSWGSTCQITAFYLTDWSPGEHRLVYTYHLAEPLDDGLKEYAAGDYTTILTVIIPAE